MIGIAALAVTESGCGGASSPAAPAVAVAATYSLQGTVREAQAGDNGATIASAVVEVADGPFAGKSAQTDDQGIYRLFAVSGRFRVRLTKPGYEPATADIGPLTGDTVTNLQLSRSTRTFSGKVTESAPTETTALAGARLRVLTGSRAGATAIADSSGSFSLDDVTGAFDVLVQADGYVDATIRVDMSQGTPRTIGLLPALKTIAETIGTTGGPRRPPTSYFRTVHNAGSIVVSKFYFYYSQDPDNPPTRTIEVWDGTRLVAAASVNRQQWFDVALETHVPGGARYEIRLSGGEWGTITIASPN